MWRLFLIASHHWMIHYIVYICPQIKNLSAICDKVYRPKLNFHHCDNVGATKLPQWLPINKDPVVLQDLLSAFHAISGL